jgi:hypothetical protein
MQHETAVANISLSEVTRENYVYLNVTELNERMYAIAAIIAGEVKEQTQPKNDKSEPA